MKPKKEKVFAEAEKFSADWLAIMPKKVAAAVKDIPLSEVRKKLPDELARYFEKIRQKMGADLEVDIGQAFSHLRNRSADDFKEGSTAKARAESSRSSSRAGF